MLLLPEVQIPFGTQLTAALSCEYLHKHIQWFFVCYFLFVFLLFWGWGKEVTSEKMSYLLENLSVFTHLAFYYIGSIYFSFFLFPSFLAFWYLFIYFFWGWGCLYLYSTYQKPYCMVSLAPVHNCSSVIYGCQQSCNPVIL